MTNYSSEVEMGKISLPDDLDVDESTHSDSRAMLHGSRKESQPVPNMFSFHYIGLYCQYAAVGQIWTVKFVSFQNAHNSFQVCCTGRHKLWFHFVPTSMKERRAMFVPMPRALS